MQYAQSYTALRGSRARKPSRLRSWSDTIGPSVPEQTRPHTKIPAYSSVTDRRLKMGSRRPSELGDSLPLEEELREQEEVYPSSESESAEEQR